MRAKIRTDHAARRARALAEGMRSFASELRLVEEVDLVCFARSEHYAALDELVASSAEVTFKPGVLRYAWGADVEMGWGAPPSVRLDMEFCHAGVTASFGLVLSDKSAGLDVYGLMFDPPGATRILPTVPSVPSPSRRAAACSARTTSAAAARASFRSVIGVDPA